MINWNSRNRIGSTIVDYAPTEHDRVADAEFTNLIGSTVLSLTIRRQNTIAVADAEFTNLIGSTVLSLTIRQLNKISWQMPNLRI